jgi:hypothetical protein
MTQVLIPTSNLTYEETEMMSLMFQAFYNRITHYCQVDNVWVLLVNTSPNLGKNAAVGVAKDLQLEYVYLIKNSVLFKKYCDTGIVERLGEVALEDRIYKLTGV